MLLPTAEHSPVRTPGTVRLSGGSMSTAEYSPVRITAGYRANKNAVQRTGVASE